VRLKFSNTENQIHISQLFSKYLSELTLCEKWFAISCSKNAYYMPLYSKDVIKMQHCPLVAASFKELECNIHLRFPLHIEHTQDSSKMGGASDHLNMAFDSGNTSYGVVLLKLLLTILYELLVASCSSLYFQRLYLCLEER
jgi:hypothetical protein